MILRKINFTASIMSNAKSYYYFFKIFLLKLESKLVLLKNILAQQE